ncbi:DNA alkylation repair protein [Mesorhizobium sp. LHD-90]|uniref:DNA alkylation repair protein n=1 Tax=Mesorhizobium sp. LHD-90 TaxID=3071414 RepID=UPI0027E06884|nr:DNA alkylation repair protein [Mesorhizobium sp. LHD-90]MDQ6434727.1 DNA alkylation repair protein [Mesorhizobium sp. LHD-90]
MGAHQTETRRAGPVWAKSIGLRLVRATSPACDEALDLGPSRRRQNDRESSHLALKARNPRWAKRKERDEGSIMSTDTAIKDILGELAALEDPRMREVNERHGDDHGVNLSHLRSLAKRLKTQHDLALQLWTTGNTAARLLATLVCRPKAFSAAELDAMIRDISAPKLLDWFIVNVVKPGRHAEELRLRWKDGSDLVGRAGWALTTDRVVRNARDLDLDALLDQIETEMKQAPEQKQWTMNHCLAEIGIRHPQHRKRAIAIGERLKVHIDYPASPGCTPPYAPMWIAEMVRRREETPAR